MQTNDLNPPEKMPTNDLNPPEKSVNVDESQSQIHSQSNANIEMNE